MSGEKKEEVQPSPGSPGKEGITTKAEYNRWLISQEKWQTAEDIREQGKTGEEVIKERQRRHTTQGLSRQQAAAVQMKKASESLEAHREANLTLGRSVYEEVAGWRMGAKATKDDWASYGKAIKETTKANNATAASKAALTENKKAQAAVTRDDDQKKEKARKDQRDALNDAAKKQAEKVRQETGDAVTDAAKRIFYEQRLKSANDTKVRPRSKRARTQESSRPAQQGGHCRCSLALSREAHRAHPPPLTHPSLAVLLIDVVRRPTRCAGRRSERRRQRPLAKPRRSGG